MTEFWRCEITFANFAKNEIFVVLTCFQNESSRVKIIVILIIFNKSPKPKEKVQIRGIARMAENTKGLGNMKFIKFLDY